MHGFGLRCFIWLLLLAWLIPPPARMALAQAHQPPPAANPALARAASPYLRAHAHDLVRWRTWGKAAFEEARRLRRPVFLSVGYLACYWCTVMKRESFSDPAIAALLNTRFVPVLVDREARPDVDALHMSVTAALNGVAGWPNNVFLLPDGRPFLARGYMPKAQFARLLRRVAETWRRQPRKLEQAAGRIAGAVEAHLQRAASAASLRESLSPEAFRCIARDIAARFDPFHGGMDKVPKHFRQPLLMLLARAALWHDLPQAKAALRTTLSSIVRAGVHDHLAGGFFRYATDPAWNEPHFEKMLYDQALLADILREGWRIFGDARLKRAALRALDFADRELKLDGGAFAATLSAVDAHGREGGYYLFTPDELKRILGARDAAFALKLFETFTEGALAGQVMIHLQEADGLPPGRARRLRAILQKLRTARDARPRPARDDKVIAAWNGMMIAALARAGQTWKQGCLVTRAARAMRFVLDELHDARKGLARYWLNGKAHGQGTLADYAHVLDALLALHDAQPAAGWLKRAQALAREARARFHDEKRRRWWFAQGESGFMRLPPPADSALPAADGIMALALLRLAARTGDDVWRQMAGEIIARQMGKALEKPLAHVTALRVADMLLRGDDAHAQYAARGHVRAAAHWLPGKSGRPAKDGETGEAGEAGARAFIIVLAMSPGWHVQAARPDDPNLIPTRAQLARPAGARLEQVRYPEPVSRRLAFSGQPLKLLEGVVFIRGRVRGARGAPVLLRLRVQACDDNVCLPPQDMPLWLPPPGAAALEDGR